MTDKDYLKLAIDESMKAQSRHQYGAVVVRDGEILAINHNRVWEEYDPSAHAEVSVIRSATKKLKQHNLEGATLYASHEPCVMCFCCAVWANITRIVYANPATDSGDSYEFDGVSLKDLAEKIQRKIVIERLDISL